MFCHPIRFFKWLIIVLCLFIIIGRLVQIKRKSKRTVIVQKIDDFQEVIVELEPFYIRFPNFADEESKTWFYNSTYYRINSRKCPNHVCDERGILFNQSNDHRLVRLALIKNGLYNSDDCGYNYGDEAVRRQFHTNHSIQPVYDEAILYTVPDGWSFQHFLDGIGPKLAHSHVYLKQYVNAKVIILRGARFDRSVKEIWSMLGRL